MHPRRLRCSSLKYSRYSRSSRLAREAPRPSRCDARLSPRAVNGASMEEYELYLIRHGVAEERGEAWPDDTKRPLSEDGIVRLRKSVRGLARLGLTLDVVL